jgi:Domain of unknown function (DUF4328)/Protein of unknown function (DUF2510)
VSEHSGYPGAPPGWYPDPAGGPGQRWWDGYAWTEATVLPQQPPPPPPPWAGAPPPLGVAASVAPWVTASQRLSAFNASKLVGDELGMVPIARLAVVMPAVYYLVNLVVQRVNADQLRAVGHQFRLDWHDAQHGITPPPYHGPSGFSTVSLIVGLFTLAAVVVACVWQHRAAAAGRALGIPSRRSPAWGVGSWFVPVVNLWVPYSAIRDCLPPDDPHRPRVLQWWIAWLVAAFVSSLAGICALFSTAAALVLSIPAALACLAVIGWAPGIVSAVAAAHREAVARATREPGALRA